MMMVRSSSSSTTDDKRTAFNKFINDLVRAAPKPEPIFIPIILDPYAFWSFARSQCRSETATWRLTGNEFIEAGSANFTGGLIAAGAYSFMHNRLQMGTTIKPLYRVSIFQEPDQRVEDVMLGLNPDDSVVNELFGHSKLSNRAFGLGLDLGVKYDLPYLERIRPAVGFTWQDIGDTRFLSDKPLPQDIPQSISVAVAVHPDWAFIRNTICFDLRNINKSEDFLNMVHMGFESVFWKWLALRGGIQQGYLTGGVGVDFPFIQADVFVTAREAATYAHLQEVRTIGAKVGFAF